MKVIILINLYLLSHDIKKAKEKINFQKKNIFHYNNGIKIKKLI